MEHDEQIRCVMVQHKEQIKAQLQRLKALNIDHPIYRPATLTLDGTELNALPLREDLTSEQLQSLTDVRLVTKNSFKTKKMTQQSAKDGVAPWLKHVTAELSKSTRWSEEELNSLPKLLHWRLLGDILLFTLMSRDIEREQHDETQLQRLHDVAQAFLSFFGQQKLRSIVVESRGRGIGGELRTPDPKHVRLLWSHVTDNEPATTTVHVENGVQVCFDLPWPKIAIITHTCSVQIRCQSRDVFHGQQRGKNSIRTSHDTCQRSTRTGHWHVCRHWIFHPATC